MRKDQPDTSPSSPYCRVFKSLSSITSARHHPRVHHAEPQPLSRILASARVSPHDMPALLLPSLPRVPHTFPHPSTHPCPFSQHFPVSPYLLLCTLPTCKPP